MATKLENPESSTQTYQTYDKNIQPNAMNAPAPPPIEPDPGCFERNQKNKPQSNSVGTASLIFVTGGMNVAWGFGFNSGFKFDVSMCISWFIGAIVGVIIVALIFNRLQKKYLMLPATLGVMLSGILFTASSNEFAIIMAGRYINGIANGVAFVTCLVMAGEESAKFQRGMLSSSIEAMCFNVGIFTQVTLGASWSYAVENGFTLIQLLGILTIFYGALALILGIFLLVESPIYFLVRNQEQQAIECLRRLQRPHVVTNETYQQLYEHKIYIAENKDLTLRQSFIAGLPALVKMCFYRGMVALSFSMYTTYAVLSIIHKDITGIVIYGTLRYLGTLFPTFMMDCVGRKRPILFGALICGGMAIGVGYLYDDATLDNLSAAMYLLSAYQFFAGIFVAASSTYLTEAFPLAVKGYYIGAVFIFEMLVQIIIACCTDVSAASIAGYFYVLAVLSFIFVIFGIFCLPETKKTTLREAQSLFRTMLVKTSN